MFPSRGRLIAALLLSALVLLTLDSRGNAAFNTVRDAFGGVTAPISGAFDVVASPFRNTWAAMTEVDDLREENATLRDRIAGAEADLIAAENAIRQANELRETLDIEALTGIPRVTGDVIGDSPSNFEQRVEINRGKNDGVRTGMPVVGGGLIGRVTKAGPSESVVMLATDPDYAVRVKIVPSTQDPAETTVPPTTPTGIPLDSIQDVVNASSTSSTSTTTEPDDVVPEGTAPAATLPGGGTSTTAAPSTSERASSVPSSQPVDESTSTTSLPSRPKETGSLHGNGPKRLPSISFAENFTAIEVGDIVLTTGGSKSLAPADIPVGKVANVINDSGRDGVQIEVELTADLDRLNFLTVLLYQPPTELAVE